MTNRTIILAIVVSTGIHLAILVPVLSDRQTLVIDSPTVPAMQLAVIVSPTTEDTRDTNNTNAAMQPEPHTTDKPAMQPAAKQTATKQPAENRQDTQPDMQNTTEAKKSVTSSDQLAMIEHDVLTYLHTQFRVRFQYPLLARKRGWSGEVVIALNVNHHGLIDNIAVKKSSGYSLLDDNAVQTFRDIGAVTPAIQSRIHREQQFSIPVIYTLTGG